MAEARKRDVLPDLLKALLILSVLLQHSATALKTGVHLGEGNWTNWLSASPFNMQLFMGICGYYFYYSAKRRTLAACGLVGMAAQPVVPVECHDMHAAGQHLPLRVPAGGGLGDVGNLRPALHAAA